MQEEQLVVRDLEITIIRKSIKNMYLRVRRNGEVEVSAPLKMKTEMIESFVICYVIKGSACPGLGIVCSDHQSRHPRKHHRTRTHAARLKSHVHDCAWQPLCTERSLCGLEGDHLRMRR